MKMIIMTIYSFLVSGPNAICQVFHNNHHQSPSYFIDGYRVFPENLFPKTFFENSSGKIFYGCKVLFALLIAGFLTPSVLMAQPDLSQWVKPVHKGESSTALSIFDTSPESPDGNLISFVKYPKIVKGGHGGTPVTAHLMVKDRQNGGLKKIADVLVNNHNGANAIWANDRLLAAQVQQTEAFEVFDVKTGESKFGKIEGELGHKSFGGKILFSRSNERLRVHDPAKQLFEAEEEGIWELDTKTGKETKLVDFSAIVRAFTSQNPEITGKDAMILHVEPNPKGDKILFDYRYRKQPGKRHKQLQGFVNADGSGIRWVPKRPMHVVWYDNRTMLGVDVADTDKKIYRYDLYGKEMGLLAGTACHLGTSPDRKWYAGEEGYYSPMPDGYTRVFLYQKGETEPVGMLSEWQNKKITWGWVAHVNPSFSSDSERLYFIRAVDGQDKFEAVYLDLREAGLLND